MPRRASAPQALSRPGVGNAASGGRARRRSGARRGPRATRPCLVAHTYGGGATGGRAPPQGRARVGKTRVALTNLSRRAVR